MTTSKDYSTILSVEQLKILADKLLAEGKPIGFDLETGYFGPDAAKRSVDHYHKDQFVVGFSFTNDEGWARYVPLRHDDGNNIDDPEGAWEAVREMLTHGHIVAHNAKFELAAVLKAAGYRIGEHGSLTDTMLDTFIVSLAHTGSWRTMIALKDVVFEFFGHQMMHIEELWPDKPNNWFKNLRFNTLSALDPQVYSYACEDAVWVLPLRNKVTELALKERPFMHSLELEIMKIMHDVERYGVHIDWDGIDEAYSQALTFVPLMEAHVKEELGKLAGRDLSELNLNSAPQMKKLLFKDIGMSTTRQTAKGAEASDLEDWQRMSTDKKSLVALSAEYSAIKELLEFREVKNLTNRLKKWMTEYNQAFDGRVHANYKQAGAEGADGSTAPGSGRFSASDPAIQQLPKKWKWVIGDEETGVNGQDFWKGNFRNFITATPGCYLLTYDYSQVELRMLAGASQEPTLLTAFQSDEDVHTLTAAMMLDKHPSEVDEETERPIGKTFNFALMYGMGVKSLAEQLGFVDEYGATDIEYAKVLYARYFERFTKIAAWKSRTEKEGLAKGYAETLFGRKIPVWELRNPSNAIKAHGMRLLINAPIQGAAADYMKIAMFRAATELKKRGWWGTKVTIIMNQHDALTFEVSNDIDPNELRDILQGRVVFGEEISKPMAGYPPIRADWELGQRWGSSTKWSFAQKAEFVDGVWQVQPEPAVDNLGVELAAMPLPSEWNKFISKLKASSGPTKVIVNTPKGEIAIPFTSYVTASDAKVLQKTFQDAIIKTA